MTRTAPVGSTEGCARAVRGRARGVEASWAAGCWPEHARSAVHCGRGPPQPEMLDWASLTLQMKCLTTARVKRQTRARPRQG